MVSAATGLSESVLLQSIKEDMVNHFKMQQRMARLAFLGRSLLCGVVFLIAASLTHMSLIAFFVGVPLAIVVVLVGFALTAYAVVWDTALHVRRLHDINCSGWWAVLSFLKPFSWLMTVVLVCWPGTYGHNRFGTSPR
jgi:uncharacterized membrane protein YhaH (DUF805 family)